MAFNHFNNAQDLYEWLRSDAGLEVRSFDNYAIIHYDKTKSKMEMPHVQQSRSIIWDTEANRAVCVSPGRGFKCSESQEGKVVCVEEFVDGVMVNMFWDRFQGRWRIATRTVMDGFNNCHGTRSFHELFIETFGLKRLDLEGEGDFKKQCWYSFVLQHPEERIVVTTGTPELKLVDTNDENISPLLATLLPRQFTGLNTIEDVRRFVKENDNVNFQGVVFYLEGVNRRFKMRTDAYEFARCFRGNQSKLPYIWLNLYSTDRLDQYLEIYPEEAEQSSAIVARYLDCVAEMSVLIDRLLVAHTLNWWDVSRKYKRLLSEFARGGSAIDTLPAFMKGQPTARKLWLVNYEERYGDAP